MSLHDPVLNNPLRKRRQVDGRRLRSERTRHLIIEAYLDLLRLAPGMPTAGQIAEKAGYSVRSIFERFSDLDALSLAAADYALAVGQAEAVARDVEGDRPTRIRSHVETRAYACEKWLPLWRILIGIQIKVADLKPRIALARHGNMTRLKLMYASELSTLEAPVRDQLLVAMVSLISFESWDLMREHFGLSPEACQDVWRTTIDRMLPPTLPRKAFGAAAGESPRASGVKAVWGASQSTSQTQIGGLMAKKPGKRTEYVLFNVIYEDGSQRSNRRVPLDALEGLEKDMPARAIIEAQDLEVAEKSGKAPLAIKSLERAAGQ